MRSKQLEIIYDPMAVAYELAMAGLSQAIKEEELVRDLRLYEEYAMIDLNGSVSGLEAV